MISSSDELTQNQQKQLNDAVGVKDWKTLYNLLAKLSYNQMVSFFEKYPDGLPEFEDYIINETRKKRFVVWINENNKKERNFSIN